jgi:hypothetical protein
MVLSRTVAAVTVRGYWRSAANGAGTLRAASFGGTAAGGARSAIPAASPAPSTPNPARHKAHHQGERLAGAGRT